MITKTGKASLNNGSYDKSQIVAVAKTYIDIIVSKEQPMDTKK